MRILELPIGKGRVKKGAEAETFFDKKTNFLHPREEMEYKERNFELFSLPPSFHQNNAGNSNQQQNTGITGNSSNQQASQQASAAQQVAAMQYFSPFVQPIDTGAFLEVCSRYRILTTH